MPNARRSAVLLRPLAAAALAVLVGAAAPTPAAAADAPDGWTIYLKDSVGQAGRASAADSVGFAQVTGAAVDHHPIVRLVRGGSVIAAEPAAGATDRSGVLAVPALLAGDAIEIVDATTGAAVARTSYDGLPSFGPEVCAGVRTASGRRSPGSSILRVGAYSYVRGKSGYGTTGTSIIDGRATGDGTDTFTATFDQALEVRSLLYAEARRIEGDVLVNSYVERRVLACPLSADKTAPKGKLDKPKGLNKLRLSSFTKGLSFGITPSEAVTATAEIRLRTGKGKRARATLVGSLKATKLAAGKRATLKVKVTSAGKRRLRKASRTRAGGRVAITFTLTDLAGNKTTLPATTVGLPRR